MHTRRVGRPLLPLLACAAACGRADLVVIEAVELGTVPRSPWVQGRDGGSSGRAFGRTVWVYGDTVLEDPDEHGSNWHTNSFDHAEPTAWREGFETPVDEVGAPRLFVELTAEERAWDDAHAAEDCAAPPCGVRWALWPGAPVYDEARGRAWILYGLYNEAAPSGIGIASWDGLDEPVVRHRVDGSWLLFPGPEPEWANAPVAHDGHLYAFACPLRGLSRPCMLGRAPLEAPDDPRAWRFFDGTRWSTDMDEAAPLFQGAPIMEVSDNEALGRWLLVYSAPFDRRVVARTAPALEGPWSGETVLLRAPGEPPYDAVHHPELEEDGGRVQYVTYSRPTTGWFGSEHALWLVVLARP